MGGSRARGWDTECALQGLDPHPAPLAPSSPAQWERIRRRLWRRQLRRTREQHGRVQIARGRRQFGRCQLRPEMLWRSWLEWWFTVCRAWGFVFSNILVVCTGNICRSPIGEGLLKAKLKSANVLSAGISAMVGWPADPTSVEIMLEKGFDISGHRAQQATRPILAGVELILTLDQGHNDWLNSRYPEFRGKVHKILKWRDNADVPDPYRQPREAFEQAYGLIEQGVGDWVKRLG